MVCRIGCRLLSKASCFSTSAISYLFYELGNEARPVVEIVMGLAIQRANDAFDMILTRIHATSPAR